MEGKELLRERFSSKPDIYYRVELFENEGFTRKRCSSCKKYFWSIQDREFCPDQPCSIYEFLGDPPTTKRFDYLEAWKQTENFFIKNGHSSVKRYPVVCRWRPDLFFTVASIIDFQRIEGGKVIFELPNNPLVVPQVCMRFNDIQNVGLSGKHFSSFCMIGQHSIANSEGYWKNKCVQLDFDLLRGPFGISPEEIVFLEDVWIGYGAFGYSLEYFVRGLELGNAVFTTFQGTPTDSTDMKEKVIDMGAGLERFAWITQGTATGYESAFGPVLQSVIKTSEVEYDADFISKFTRLVSPLNWESINDHVDIQERVAKEMNISADELWNKVLPMQAIYSLTDHVRTLVFSIADGGLPSNVGGGYNLRVVLRRALDFLETYNWNLNLDDIAEWHINYLGEIFPELGEKKDEIATILEVEQKRYQQGKERVDRIIQNLNKTNQKLDEKKLIELYDSEGISPEQISQRGVKIDTISDFYTKVTARHNSPKFEEKISPFKIDDLPNTILLFYEDPNLYNFSAKILRIIEGKYVILDKTAFYARAGGQEPDHGLIGSFNVLDTTKQGSIVIHKVERCALEEGDVVECNVNIARRNQITKHHTATHILNGSARKVLGSWVWQNSAFKDSDKARLDITHYAALTDEQVNDIERLANDVVRMNLPVTVDILPRIEAERMYGFSLYQGGVAPSKNLRTISIGSFDVEGCGGTHISHSGEIGLIKIIKTERIQDGVVRLEFVAGEKAVELIQKRGDLLSNISGILECPQEKIVESITVMKDGFEESRRNQRGVVKQFSNIIANEVISQAIVVGDLKAYVNRNEFLDEDYHITIGAASIEVEPNLVYCGLVLRKKKISLFLFSGQGAQDRGVKAFELIKELTKIVRGSGGGDARFAQGGGANIEGMNETTDALINEVRKILQNIT